MAPESIFVDINGTIKVMPGSAYSILRPEAVESWFHLWRLTHKQQYREWSWQVFEAFEQHSRVPGGHSGVKDVEEIPVEHDDTMQSFWLAETLKYLYLTFGADSLYPTSTWVYNTEAHPLRIRKRDQTA